jgi:hypothetical protein
LTAKNSKEKTAIDLGDGRRLELYRDYSRDPKHPPVSEITLIKDPPKDKDIKRIVNTALLSALSTLIALVSLVLSFIMYGNMWGWLALILITVASTGVAISNLISTLRLIQLNYREKEEGRIDIYHMNERYLDEIERLQAINIIMPDLIQMQSEQIIGKLADSKQDYQMKRHQLRRIIEDMEKDVAETYSSNPNDKKSIFMPKNDTEETTDVDAASLIENPDQ